MQLRHYPIDRQTPTLIKLNPYQPEVEALLAKSEEYLANLYPPESNHFESQDGLTKPNVLFLGLQSGPSIVGCGAVKILTDRNGQYGELKRLFILETHRGKGLSKLLMSALESFLLSEGVFLCRLETGIHQPEALGLYQRLGYEERGAYGNYKPDPLSVFMEKRLASA